eukprot:2346583-Amphidinium_carterae.1
MRTLSLLLAEGAKVLWESSTAAEHEEFLDGRGCVYLTVLDTAVTVEEPELQVEWNRPKAECFYDEYTGIELPHEGVIQARHEEMAENLTVHAGSTVTRGRILRRQIFAVDWLSRKQGAAGDVMSTFAVTPALETLRLLCSLCMSAAEYDDFVIQVWDISRAHQHCQLKRKIFIRLPEEDSNSEQEGVCGLLVTALNSVRDAAQ